MGIFGNIGNAVKKAVKDTKNATVKAVVDTGHVTGKVVTSKVGQAVIGGALAVSGVGLPAAAAIGAAAKAGGNAIKPGGNFKTAFTGAYQGAALGAGAAVAGAGVRAVKSGAGVSGFKNILLHGKGAVPTATAKISDGPPPMAIEPEYAVESIVPGVTDSGIIKHDATDLLPEVQPAFPLPDSQRKSTPTDLFTPFKRRLLGDGSPSKEKGSDNNGNVGPRYRTRENAATVLPAETDTTSNESNIGSSGVVPTEAAPKADNLPMLLAVGAAGVIMLVVLGKQVRK